jgi:hypothetical protein
MDLNGDNDLSFSDGCVYNKHHCTPFPLNGVLMQRKLLGLCTQTYVVPWQKISWKGKIFYNFH